MAGNHFHAQSTERDPPLTRDSRISLDSLQAYVGAVDIDSGGHPALRAPRIVVEPSLKAFLSIVDRLDGWWTPVGDRPIPIPTNPDQEYYRFFALKFAESYFYKNLLKCIIALELLQHHIGEEATFTDLGAGSGAFSIALIAARQVPGVDLVDYSETQLGIASMVLDRLMYNGKRSARLENIANFSTVGRDCVASYAMGEAIQNDINVLDKIETSKSFILVDRPDIVRGVDAYLRERGHHVFGRYVEFSVADNLRPMIEGGGGRFSVLIKI